MKSLKAMFLATALIGTIILGGCAGSTPGAAPAPAPAPAAAASVDAANGQEIPNFDTQRMITVVSREEGSGTRGAFIELLGIERDGVDYTSPEAVIGNGTSAVLSNVASNTYSIGYVSLGSLNETVRAVPVDGVYPSPEAVQDGTYPVFRAFYLAVTDLTDVSQDFVDFILSAEGQEVVSGRGYITVDPEAVAFVSSGASGDIVITGSTSVAPIMEHLREAYIALNPNANIEVHSTGSGAGITAARDGSVDIGMSSRELRESELAEVDAIAIAYDGIAIVVHNDNPVPDMDKESVRQVFEGEIINWSSFFN